MYLRGPMALQALRNVIGDDAFFELARDWAQAPGSRSLEEWMVMAQSETTVDLGALLPGLDLCAHRSGAHRREWLRLTSMNLGASAHRILAAKCRVRHFDEFRARWHPTRQRRLG